MRNTRGGSLKLRGALRGDGVLIVGARKIAVNYQVDVFSRGQGFVANGEVEGRLAALRGAPGPAQLKLADGVLVGITLRDVGSEFAAFDADDAGAEICEAVRTKAEAAA